jgi:hypothetical protein
MQSEKKVFLDTMRKNTAYGTFRAIIDIISEVVRPLCVLGILGGLLFAVPEGHYMIGALVLVSSLIWLIVNQFMEEVSLMLADIADTLALQTERGWSKGSAASTREVKAPSTSEAEVLLTN